MTCPIRWQSWLELVRSLRAGIITDVFTFKKAFSKMINVHSDLPRGHVKMHVLIQEVWTESESTVLTSSQVMPILLVHGSKYQDFKLYCALVWVHGHPTPTLF